MASRLEVILEAEVAQHFKVGAVTGGDAYPLDIRGTDALLAGGHPVAGRLLLAQEPLFHGGHAAVDQQQAVVVLGHQRETAQAQMALALKKGEIFLSQFIQTSPLHRSNLLLFDGFRRHGPKKQPSPPLQGRRLKTLRGTTQIAAREDRRFWRPLTPCLRPVHHRGLKGGCNALLAETFHQPVPSLHAPHAAGPITAILLFFTLQLYRPQRPLSTLFSAWKAVSSAVLSPA